jgi:membrane fusion protein (multidrug efflux system)
MRTDDRDPSIPQLRVDTPAPSYALAGVLLLLLSGCGEARPPAATKPPQVVVAEVSQGAVPIAMSFPGTVKAVRLVHVIPHVSGYIDTRYFTEGADVKEGDPLYLIAPQPFEATLDQYQAQLVKDQSNVDYWSKEVERYTEAVKNRAVSQEQYNQTLTKAQEARATLDQTEAQIDNAKIDLGYTRIVAPFDARAQQTRLYEGDLANEYQDVLTTLVQMDPVHVIFNLTRRELAEIQEMEHTGVIAPAREHARVELALPDGSTYPHTGKLDFVSAHVDSSTDNLTLRAVVPNDFSETREGTLVPGQYVPVRLILGQKPDALLIPKAALLETQSGKHVLVVNGNDKVESRPVQVGSSYEGRWIIESGLDKGERVIVEGLQKVRPGTTVTVEPKSRPSST